MLAMEMKGLTYISHRLDPSKKEHKAPEFIALNPWGKAPVLKDGNLVIYESIAILAYLEHKHPNPALFGTTAKETGHIWQRVFEVMNYARDPINNGVVRPLIRGQAEHARASIQACAIEAHEALLWVENILANTSYLAGNKISAADVVYLPIIQGLMRAGRREDALQLKLSFEDFGSVYPHIWAWAQRIETVPGYDKAYPPHWKNS